MSLSASPLPAPMSKFSSQIAALPRNSIASQHQQRLVKAFASYTSGPITAHQRNLLSALTTRATRQLLSSINDDNYEDIIHLLQGKLKLRIAQHAEANKLKLTLRDYATTRHGRKQSRLSRQRVEAILAQRDINELFSIDTQGA